MSKNKSVTMIEKDQVIFRSGLATGVACAPKNMTFRQINDVVNREHPTGIASLWKCKKKILEDGTKTPCICLEDKNRRHYYLEC